MLFLNFTEYKLTCEAYEVTHSEMDFDILSGCQTTYTIIAVSCADCDQELEK